MSTITMCDLNNATIAAKSAMQARDDAHKRFTDAEKLFVYEKRSIFDNSDDAKRSYAIMQVSENAYDGACKSYEYRTLICEKSREIYLQQIAYDVVNILAKSDINEKPVHHKRVHATIKKALENAGIECDLVREYSHIINLKAYGVTMCIRDDGVDFSFSSDSDYYYPRTMKCGAHIANHDATKGIYVFNTEYMNNFINVHKDARDITLKDIENTCTQYMQARENIASIRAQAEKDIKDIKSQFQKAYHFSWK